MNTHDQKNAMKISGTFDGTTTQTVQCHFESEISFPFRFFYQNMFYSKTFKEVQKSFNIMTSLQGTSHDIQVPIES